MASQGVRYRVFTANSQVHFQDRACGNCGEQVALVQTFFRVIRFYSVSFPSKIAHYSIIHVPCEDIRTCLQSVPVTTPPSKPHAHAHTRTRTPTRTHTHTHTHTHTQRMSKEKCARLRGGVPYVKVYRYNPKHLCPKMNGYGDNDQRKVWSSGGSTHCTCQLTVLSLSALECGVILRQLNSR
jgi:hypothetical protein